MQDTQETPQCSPPLTPEQTAKWDQWDSRLTTREDEIALRLAEGETNRSIAHDLGISIKTIDTHRGHILKKLGCKNNVELCRLAIRLDLIKP